MLADIVSINSVLFSRDILLSMCRGWVSVFKRVSLVNNTIFIIKSPFDKFIKLVGSN